MEEFLRSTELLDCDEPTVRKKAFELTMSAQSEREQSVVLFYFVRDGIKYQLVDKFPDKEYFKASHTLERGHGFCIPKAILLASLARASGIPSRLHVVDIRNFQLPKDLKEKLGTDLMRHHTYVEMYVGEKWVKANPAFNIELCNKFNLVPVEFTGEGDAMFSPVDLEGTPHIEYFEDYGLVDDLDYDAIRKVFEDGYPHLF